jgi:hypothetical protein
LLHEHEAAEALLPVNYSVQEFINSDLLLHEDTQTTWLLEPTEARKDAHQPVRDLSTAMTTGDMLQNTKVLKGQDEVPGATCPAQEQVQPRRSKRGLILSTRYDSLQWTR